MKVYVVQSTKFRKICQSDIVVEPKKFCRVPPSPFTFTRWHFCGIKLLQKNFCKPGIQIIEEN